ncbi:hypothetical protein DPMN_123568 [Dreissena polymorpha]|uniref:Uncharacterized protein n=1 Tax=Dreissena polymorpha TaxID=45954 RepID=A0A9D4GRK5_DREPO|nr:hypothetical protein DPMN_123568 [Dreissena polymorpha]
MHCPSSERWQPSDAKFLFFVSGDQNPFTLHRKALLGKHDLSVVFNDEFNLSTLALNQCKSTGNLVQIVGSQR